jgi:hypothetical protein
MVYELEAIIKKLKNEITNKDLLCISSYLEQIGELKDKVYFTNQKSLGEKAPKSEEIGKYLYIHSKVSDYLNVFNYLSDNGFKVEDKRVKSLEDKE